MNVISKYNCKKILLDRDDGAATEKAAGVEIYWTIQDSTNEIELALAVYFSRNPMHNKDKWISFGLSEMGGMIGADMFLFVAGTTVVIDCHGVEYGFPIADKCGQDWKYINSTFHQDDHGSSGWLIVEVKRSLVGNDLNEDLSFVDDSNQIIPPMKVIAAWGDVNGSGELVSHQQEISSNNKIQTTIRPHGIQNRVKGDIRFFDCEYSLSNSQSNQLEYIDLVPDESFIIPTEVTTYKNFCFTLDQFPELKDHEEVYIVKFEQVIDGNNEDIVHHIDLHGTDNEILGSDKRLCRAYMNMIHPWEAGASRVFELPSDVGIPMGRLESAYKGFRVEIHYHNPLLSSRRNDRSGVRVYFTRKKVKYFADLLMVGDPSLALIGKRTVPWSDDIEKSARHSYYCPKDCFTKEKLTKDFTKDYITVFKEVFHMHSSGKRMVSMQFNELDDVVRVSGVNHFDFRQGAGCSSQSHIPFKISQGDSFVVSCYYNKRGVVFGSGSDQEMCQTFLWYYPRSAKLRCGNFDAEVREANKSGLEYLPYNISVGCETKYRLDKINSEKEFDRLVAPSENACQFVPKEYDAVSGSYPFQNTSIFDSWSTLLSSSLLSEEGVEAKEDSSLIERDDEKELSPCTLCKYGKRPSLLEKTIKGHEDWTCDEMDAFIPIMFEKDQASLVFIDPNQLPSCEQFQNYFGQMCGCSSNEINPYNFRLAKLASGIFSFSVLLFISLRKKYYTSSRENSLESIELKSLGNNNAYQDSEE
ncbi:hypothetical protein CTEN210_05704 [Chaetoceros tenuissimus]|uniref:DOMON domain-containing protein n=1 Tax=Chaetoceros tenuissimus TaxID=426638 RepID=A0AAD3CP11_9STRA|nr:hypothetical protein CTEN210_05704 [Chaetoceros tenuissimus]